MSDKAQAQGVTGIIIGVAVGRLILYREVTLAEFLLYFSLGILIVGYWCVQACLRIQEKKQAAAPVAVELEEDLEELEKQVAIHNSKINAILLRLGLSATG